MGGRTGYPDYDNNIGFGGPEYFEDIEEHFDALIGETRPTAAALPAASESWPGRQVWVELDSDPAANGLYIRNADNSGWVKIPRRPFGVGASVLGGAVPANASVLEQAGFVTVNTSAGGDTGFSYPNPFPNGVIGVNLQRVDFTSFGLTEEVLNVTQQKDICRFRVYQSNGSILANTNGVKYYYRALGW